MQRDVRRGDGRKVEADAQGELRGFVDQSNTKHHVRPTATAEWGRSVGAFVATGG